jgi:hypothetical protein
MAASIFPANIPTYVSGVRPAAAAAAINAFEDLGNVVVTNWTHICIDNHRTAAMLGINEC